MDLRALSHARYAIALGATVGALGVVGMGAPAYAASAAATTTKTTATKATAKNLSVQELAFSPTSAPAGPGSTVTLTWTIGDKNAAATNVGGDVFVSLQGSTPNAFIGAPLDISFSYGNDLASYGGATYVSGTPQSSTYTYTFAVPHYANATTAEWTVNEVSAQDSAGATLTAQSAALANFSRSVTGTGETVDASVPIYGQLEQVSNFANTRPYAYVNGVSATIDYSLNIQEQDSGFWKGSIKLAGPGGATISQNFAYSLDEEQAMCGGGYVGGTDQDLTCTVPVTFPANSAAGVWTVSSLSLTSNDGKAKTYGKLNAVPITVTSDSTLTASGFTVSQSQVNNWTSSPTVQVGMAVAGAQGGVSAIYVDTDGPTTMNACMQLSTTPTLNADGTYSVPLRFDQGGAQCQVDGIVVVDGSGDVALYGSKYGAPNPGLTITQVPAIAPTVTAASLNTTSIAASQIGTTPVIVTVTLGPWTAPVDVYNTMLYDSTGAQVSGSENSGNVSVNAQGQAQLTLSLPSGLAPGNYTVGFVLQDTAVQVTWYGGPGNTPVPGGPLTLTVTAG